MAIDISIKKQSESDFRKYASIVYKKSLDSEPNYFEWIKLYNMYEKNINDHNDNFDFIMNGFILVNSQCHCQNDDQRKSYIKCFSDLKLFLHEYKRRKFIEYIDMNLLCEIYNNVKMINNQK